MMIAAEAFCPGRVCLVGEDLDWAIGPSVLAAIDIGVTVHAQRAHDGGVSSGWPIHEFSSLPRNRPPIGDNSRLLHVTAAAQSIARRYGQELESLRIDVSSNLPAAAGLSSSAAVILATIGAISTVTRTDMSMEEIISLAYEVEADVLVTGAGQMDFYGCAQGGVNILDCSRIPPSVNERCAIADTDFKIFIVDTGIARRTGDIIKEKRERWARQEPDIVKYMDSTLRLVLEMMTVLSSEVADLCELGNLLSKAHMLLRDRMHSSNELLDECVAGLMRAGAYGAKLTGTGHGGCAFGIFPADCDQDRIAAALADLNVAVIPTQLNLTGLVCRQVMPRDSEFSSLAG